MLGTSLGCLDSHVWTATAIMHAHSPMPLLFMQLVLDPQMVHRNQ